MHENTSLKPHLKKISEICMKIRKTKSKKFFKYTCVKIIKYLTKNNFEKDIRNKLYENGYSRWKINKGNESIILSA